MTLRAFHNDPKIKAKYFARLKKHHRLDEIVQGIGFQENGETRGCAVGCTLDNYDHKAYETELGIPEWLAHLEDKIFEGLPAKKAPKFAVDFLEAIPWGADLAPVKHSFCAFLMRENYKLVSASKMEEKLKREVLTATCAVLTLHETALKTGKWDEKAAEAAKAMVWEARVAGSAVAGAVEAAVIWMAEAAGTAGAEARKAWATARAAAREAGAAWEARATARTAAMEAEAAAYIRFAKELIRLLKETKGTIGRNND